MRERWKSQYAESRRGRGEQKKAKKTTTKKMLSEKETEILKKSKRKEKLFSVCERERERGNFKEKYLEHSQGTT